MIVNSPCFVERRRNIESKSYHVRHKSMGDDRLSVMDNLNNSLTNRYLRKLSTMRENDNNNFPEQEGMCFARVLTPKFIIKRKYLSFDVKQKSASEESQSKHKLKATKYSKNKFDTIIDQYSDNKEVQKLTNCTELIQQKLMNSINPMGMNLNKSKYKCIYIKRNRHRINLNPQLMCKVKKTTTMVDNRPELVASDDWQGRINNNNKYVRGTDAGTYRKRFHSNNLQFEADKNSYTIKQAKPIEQKEKKMFRPWSGIYPEDNF